MPTDDTYEYQRSSRYFAQAADGLEDLVAAELGRLGATDASPAYRGVYFSADPRTLYRVNYASRLSTRVLAPLLTFDCHSAKYLYKTARSIEWSDFLDAGRTFAVFANVSDSAIRHSRYAALRVKDAVADQFRDRCGRRPNVSPHNADVTLNLYLHNNRAVLSLDTSGGSLHRRGYRRRTVEAPMQETVAAAVIELSGWDGTRPLYDPMCGSGTLLCEALMTHCRIPPGRSRGEAGRFGFEFLPDFRADLWAGVQRDLDNRIRQLPADRIAGSDADRTAVAAASANLSSLPGGKRIHLETRKFQDLAGLTDTVIVCNPPHGVRIGRTNAGELAGQFGDFLKQRCRGCEAYLYLGRRELVKRVGLRPAWKRPLKSGGLDGRLVKYEVY